MIPAFTTNGMLPPGTYTTTIPEFEERFVYGVQRKILYKGLTKLIGDLKTKIGCLNIFIDGSYVTTKRIPNDIDVCWDNSSVNLIEAKSKMPILFDFSPPRRNQQLTYNCDIFPAYISEENSKKMFIHFFQYDKFTNERKGIIHINLI